MGDPTTVDPSRERLHKFLARCGVCSRRKAEEWIAEGRVSVNGEIRTERGASVGADDEVEVDGRRIAVQRLHYLAMNKPVGVLTTLDDPHRRPTISKLMPDVGAMLRPVGRLDMDTEGLLLLTNDGELAARLTHPRYGVEKEYVVRVQGRPEAKAIDRLRKGVVLYGRRTAPAIVELESTGANESTVRITIHEGRNRQVRHMCEAVGHPVVGLRRVRVGPIALRKLPLGATRKLGHDEVMKLKAAVGLDK